MTMQGPIKDSTFAKFAKHAWIIWSLGAILYAYEFFLQVSPNIMVPQLAEAFHINAAGVGNLVAIYFYVYAAMQIPVGLLLDRYGPRRILFFAVLSCAVGSFIFSQSTDLATAMIGRGLIGFGSAFVVISCLKLITIWFPFRRFALLAGMTLTIGMIGAASGEAPLTKVVEAIGWQHTMLSLGGIGLFFAILAWMIIRDRPKLEHGIPAHKESTAQVLKNLKHLIKQPSTWFIAVYAGLMFTPITAFGALWGVPFLSTEYGMSPTMSSALISLIFIGFAIGAPLYGWFSDYTGKRKPLMYSGSIGGFASIIFLFYLPDLHTPLIGILLFSLGFFTSALMLAFSTMRDVSSLAAAATALGFMNMLNMLGGAVTQPFIGYILDKFTVHTVSNSPLYSAHAFHIALMPLPIILLLSLATLPFIKETYCRHCYQKP